MKVLMSKINDVIRGRFMFYSALAIPAVLLATMAMGNRHKAAEEEKKSSTEPPIVELISPKNLTIVRVVGQPSFVETYERSSVFPKMTAYIKKWNVDIGDKVKKGDVLATLFVPELEEEYKTKQAIVKLDKEKVDLAIKVVKVAQADVEAAAARLKEAQAILDQYKAQVARWDSEVKRLRREVARDVVDKQVLLESENQLRSSRAAEDAAVATILKARAELDSKKATKDQDDVAVKVAERTWEVAQSEELRLKALVGYLVLPAPFDGVINARNANTFDFVLPATGDPTADQRAPHLSPGGKAAPIYVVDRTDIVRVFVDIPERDANFVHDGTKASVLIKGYSDTPIPGIVTRDSWALNVTTRTRRAEIDLENKDSKILPGMYAYAKVIIKRPNVWALPESALFSEGDQTFYYRHEKGPNGKDIAVKTEVEIGVTGKGFLGDTPLAGNWVEVTNRRLSPKKERSLDEEISFQEHPWVSINGTDEVIFADDLTAITNGGPVILGPGAQTKN